MSRTAADVAAEIFTALGTMRLASQIEGDPRVSFRSASAIRAARELLGDVDERLMFETEYESVGQLPVPRKPKEDGT